MLSLSLFVLIIIFSFSLCIDMDDIFAFYLTSYCMTTLLLCDSMLFICVGCTFIPLPPTLWFRSFPSFGSYFLKCEVLCVFASLTELVVKSRV